MFPQPCLRNVFTLSFHLRILEMSSCDIKKLNQNLCPYLVWGVGGGGRLSLSLRVQSQAKVPIDGLTSTVELTSHRVYQELVYRNEVLKTMLARSNYPSLSSSPAVFAQLLSMHFPDYLGTVYVKRKKVRFSSHFRHPSSLDDVVSVLKLLSENNKQPNFG